MSIKVIGVESDGSVEWHIPSVGGEGYATMCGLDGEDATVGQTGVIQAPRGTKIDCQACQTIWRGLRALKLRETDFV